MIKETEAKEEIRRIQALKKRFSEKLLILTHHYQRKEIVDLGDYRGDSLGLSQKAADQKACRFIVFCGVHFMAESAEILSQPHQTVQIPAMEAGCWMADMADSPAVENAWKALTEITGPGGVMPLVYMNSDASLKGFCGRNGGAICTSSNASAAFKWGLQSRDKVFFLPDRHLGQNSADQLGLPPEEIILWDPQKPLGGNSPEDIRRARVILWNGYCLVHTRFQVEHVHKIREDYPEAKIVVHPECTRQVVALADAVGSTSFIVRYVKEASPGATIVIGTEINLVHRLALEHPDKRILELHYSLCPNMFRINLKNLLWTLEHIGEVNVVRVPEGIKKEAKTALDRMLALKN